ANAALGLAAQARGVVDQGLVALHAAGVGLLEAQFVKGIAQHDDLGLKAVAMPAMGAVDARAGLEGTILAVHGVGGDAADEFSVQRFDGEHDAVGAVGELGVAIDELLGGVFRRREVDAVVEKAYRLAVGLLIGQPERSVVFVHGAQANIGA